MVERPQHEEVSDLRVFVLTEEDWRAFVAILNEEDGPSAETVARAGMQAPW